MSGMAEHLYTDHPDLYDAIQSGWDYDRDVSFVLDALERHGVDGRRLLEIGCGTGEHTCRFDSAGFEVTAVDKYEGMLDRAREKCDLNYRQDALPALSVGGKYDIVVAIRGVINHVQPDALEPAIGALASRVSNGGILVFDNAPLPPGGNEPALDVGATDAGQYVRVAHHAPAGSGTLDWRAVTFTSDGECFVNSRKMTPFADGAITEALAQHGLEVETHDGYGAGDSRTVFVARQK
ncbi:MAG: methyltransferase domain-containing protein [Halodesulfurarchaeum sp.]|nr:methyltransferase domain-containing protein [Halodesulfurarchaeum sp.]